MMETLNLVCVEEAWVHELSAACQNPFKLSNPIVLWTPPADTAALMTSYLGYPPPLHLGNVQDVLVE